MSYLLLEILQNLLPFLRIVKGPDQQHYAQYASFRQNHLEDLNLECLVLVQVGNVLSANLTLRVCQKITKTYARNLLIILLHEYNLFRLQHTYVSNIQLSLNLLATLLQTEHFKYMRDSTTQSTSFHSKWFFELQSSFAVSSSGIFYSIIFAPN